MVGLNQARGDYVVIMDDDFQNPPAEVPRLVAEIQKGFDVVYTFKKLVALWGDMIVSYSLIPLRVVAVLGVILTLLGCYSMAEMLFQNLNPSLHDPSDLEELTSVSLFFRGFQLFATQVYTAAPLRYATA
jgi:glycosyltransferase involved in cell wall biosynthesis